MVTNNSIAKACSHATALAGLPLRNFGRRLAARSFKLLPNSYLDIDKQVRSNAKRCPDRYSSIGRDLPNSSFCRRNTVCRHAVGIRFAASTNTDDEDDI